MRITIGCREPETAVKFQQRLNQLLPVLDFALKVEAAEPQLSVLLEKVELSCIISRSRIAPEERPEEVDCFSFNGAGWILSGAAGDLTIYYRRDDSLWPLIRGLFLPPLVFAGAGIGGVENVTLGVINALKDCEVCVYDALIPEGILDFIAPAAKKIFVGKRTGRHYMKQPEINSLLVEFAKSGRKVVRLKGGDPSLFGRLAEEVEALQLEQLAFRVLPGVTSLSVAAAASGLLPTRRGLNRGFTIMTPRQAGSRSFVPLTGREEKELFKVYYMAAGVVAEITEVMRADGFPADWPVSLVYDAGSCEESVVCGTVADIESKISAGRFRRRPALVLTGAGAAEAYLFKPGAPLAGRKILCRGDKNLFNQAKSVLENYGGRAVFADKSAASGADNNESDHKYDAILELDGDRIEEDSLRIAAGFVNMKITERLSCQALSGGK